MNDSVETNINPGAKISELRSEGLDALLNKYFSGRVVRKDLTKQLKEGANVPVYVLEYLFATEPVLKQAEMIANELAIN